jgi:hypothetical protein
VSVPAASPPERSRSIFLTTIAGVADLGKSVCDRSGYDHAHGAGHDLGAEGRFAPDLAVADVVCKNVAPTRKVWRLAIRIPAA